MAPKKIFRHFLHAKFFMLILLISTCEFFKKAEIALAEKNLEKRTRAN